MTQQLRVPRGTRTAGQFSTTARAESQGVLFDTQRAGEAAPAPMVLHAIGFNDEQTDCDSCGRRELRGTVVLADDDGAEVARMGTTCAGRALGRPVSRTDVRALESVRRNEVAQMLRAAHDALGRGHLAAAAMEVRDARRRGLHRPDELEAAAQAEHAVEMARRALPERWAYQVPGRAPVELDTREQAEGFVARLSRHGATLVQLDRYGQTGPGADTSDD